MESNQTEIGVPLSGNELVYKTGRRDEKKQLTVTEITIYTSPVTYNLGNIIAVNNNYICYVVKGTMIRVINIYSAARALLRGHTAGVKDIKFYSERQDLLGSVAEDGQIFIWKIQQKSNAPDGTVVETLLNLNPKNDSNTQDDKTELTYHERFVWHPKNSNVFATAASNNTVYIWFIDQLLQLDEVAQSSTPIDPVKKLSISSRIGDLSFSPCGKLLSTASQDGQVKVWDWNTSTCLYSWSPHSSSVYSLLFYSPVSVSSSSSKSQFLITGGIYNSELKIWRLPTLPAELSDAHEQNFEPPVLIQTLNFTTEDSRGFFNHLAMDSSNRFVFVANSRQTEFYVAHLNFDPRTDSLGFDNITEFPILHSILSMILINRQSQSSTKSASTLEMQLYCVQPKGIQMYHVAPSQCYLEPISTPADSNLVPQVDVVRNLDVETNLKDEQKEQQQNEEKNKQQQDSKKVEESKNYQNLTKEKTEKLEIDLSTLTATQETDQQVIISDHKKDLDLEGTPSKHNGLPTSSTQQTPTKPSPSPSPLPSPLPSPSTSEKKNSFFFREYLINEFTQFVRRKLVRKEMLAEIAKENNVTIDVKGSYIPKIIPGIAPKKPKDPNEKKLCLFISGPFDGVQKAVNQLEKVVADALAQKNKKKEIAKAKDEILPPIIPSSTTTTTAATTTGNGENNNISDKTELLIKQCFDRLNSKLDNERLERKADEEKTQKMLITMSNNINAVKNSVTALSSSVQTLDKNVYTSQTELSKLFNLLSEKPEARKDEFVGVLQQTIKTQFRDYFMPNFERSIEKSFEQLNQTVETALVGIQTPPTKPPMTGLPPHYPQQQQQQQGIPPDMMNNLNTAVTTLTTISNSLYSISINVSKNIDSQLQRLNDIITDTSSLNHKTGNNLNNISNSSPTAPKQVVRLKPKVDYEKLLTSRKFSEAVTAVVSEKDLDLVMLVCSRIDSRSFFAGRSPLKQDVLLALIQQLGFDLTKGTETKLLWLEEALLALDVKDEVIKWHVSPILSNLLNSVNTLYPKFSDPSNSFSRSFKRVVHTVNSLLGFMPQ